MSKKRQIPANPFDFERLSDALSLACATEYGQSGESGSNEARALLKGFLQQVDRDLAILDSRIQSEVKRAEATKRLLSCYRLIHSAAGKPQTERDRRLTVLAQIETEARLKNLQVRLQWLFQSLAHEIFLSTEPIKTLEIILHGKVRRGAPKKEERRNIEIAAAVEQRRRLGMTLEDASVEVSKEEVTRRNPIGPEGVRRSTKN